MQSRFSALAISGCDGFHINNHYLYSMCGRYAMAQEYEKLQRRFGFKPEKYAPTPRYNVAPGQGMPVLVHKSERVLREMRWGLIPSWAKEERIGYKMINARSETIREKPSFRSAFKSRRCLVPADGYYEWMRIPGTKLKQPYYFSMLDSEPFGFAGLWEVWSSSNGETIQSFTIITTEANELSKPVHHRMPVILHQKDEENWLDPSNNDSGLLQSLLKPFPSDRMQSYAVSTIVNSPSNNSPACIAPLDI